MSLTELLLEPRGEAGHERFHRLRDRSCGANLARKNGQHRFDWVHRRLDGRDFPVEVTLTPELARLQALAEELHVADRVQFTAVVAHDLPDQHQPQPRPRQLAGEGLALDEKPHRLGA